MTLKLDIRARNGVHIFGRSRYIILPRSKGNSVRVTVVQPRVFFDAAWQSWAILSRLRWIEQWMFVYGMKDIAC